MACCTCARVTALSLSSWSLAQGRLPHTNAGPLSPREMAALARLNPSMGLMLEGLGPAYDRLHRRAPSKDLAVRLAQLQQAGRLGVPFTTGLLLGVGETQAERRQALELLETYLPLRTTLVKVTRSTQGAEVWVGFEAVQAFEHDLARFCRRPGSLEADE